ncbi:MAG: nuclear transport factor 2 family protein [Acidobacteriota bacterium]
MSDKLKEIVQKVNEAFTQDKTEEFLALCRDDITWRVVGDTVVKGVENIRTYINSVDCEPPQFTVENLIVEGETAIANGEMTMTAKNGSLEQYSFCDVYRFSGEKIVELTSYIVKIDSEKEYQISKSAS